MNERKPVSAYRLLSTPSIKQKLYVISRRSPVYGLIYTYLDLDLFGLIWTLPIWTYFDIFGPICTFFGPIKNNLDLYGPTKTYMVLFCFLQHQNPT